MTARTRMAVLVLSRHPHSLRRCLSNLVGQLAEDDDLLIAHDAGDHESPIVALDLCRSAVPVRVTKPAYSDALTAGARATGADAIAVLEDDMVAMNGWLSALRHHLEQSPSTGAVGGPVLTFRGVRTTNSFFEGGTLEQVTRMGRHHDLLHEIPAKVWNEDIGFLARGNVAFRRELFDHGDPARLKDMSPAVEWRLAQTVRHLGLRVVYDSRIRVEQHVPAEAPVRVELERAARSMGYSATVILGDAPQRVDRLATLSWWMLVGTRRSPGLLLACTASLRGRGWPRVCLAAAHGRLLALPVSIRSLAKA
ncbi:glycosyltransferase [Streptomyces sp. NPDC007916]|uniref:glycosyltransferase family A protein n=2 Tax=unclassified Streptomyces TaxID=2593676 RepID=UPI0036EE22F4